MTARRLCVAALASAAVVPPLQIAWLIARHARNMPYWDQWGFARFALESTQGRFPRDVMWAQVNEHRVPVAYAVQGTVAWATRWDLRADAWTNLAVGLVTFWALAALARRTIAPHTNGGTVAVVLASSALVFSPGHGVSWTAGWITPAYLAVAATAVFAWLLAHWRAGPMGFAALAACAVAGALSFGSGIVLLVLLPLVPLVVPASWRRRLATAAAGAVVTTTVVVAYFHGWHHRLAHPPAVLRLEWAFDYLRYALAYVGGGAAGRGDVPGAVRWGIGMCAGVLAAVAWLAYRRPDLRPALVPWSVLLLCGFGNGLVTGFGRLANGMGTAVLERYLPNAGLFVTGVVAIAALLVADVRARSRLCGIAIVAVLAGAGVLAARAQIRTASLGIGKMAATAQKLDVERACLTSCAETADACFTGLTFSLPLTRQVCPRIEAARIGPFAGASPRTAR